MLAYAAKEKILVIEDTVNVDIPWRRLLIASARRTIGGWGNSFPKLVSLCCEGLNRRAQILNLFIKMSNQICEVFWACKRHSDSNIRILGDLSLLVLVGSLRILDFYMLICQLSLPANFFELTTNKLWKALMRPKPTRFSRCLFPISSVLWRLEVNCSTFVAVTGSNGGRGSELARGSLWKLWWFELREIHFSSS